MKNVKLSIIILIFVFVLCSCKNADAVISDGGSVDGGRVIAANYQSREELMGMFDNLT